MFKTISTLKMAAILDAILDSVVGQECQICQQHFSDAPDIASSEFEVGLSISFHANENFFSEAWVPGYTIVSLLWFHIFVLLLLLIHAAP